MIVGSGTNIKLPLGPTGVKPSKVIITSVLSCNDLFLLLFTVGLMIHGIFLSVTLDKEAKSVIGKKRRTKQLLKSY